MARLTPQGELVVLPLLFAGGVSVLVQWLVHVSGCFPRYSGHFGTWAVWMAILEESLLWAVNGTSQRSPDSNSLDHNPAGWSQFHYHRLIKTDPGPNIELAHLREVEPKPRLGFRTSFFLGLHYKYLGLGHMGHRKLGKDGNSRHGLLESLWHNVVQWPPKGLEIGMWAFVWAVQHGSKFDYGFLLSLTS